MDLCHKQQHFRNVTEGLKCLYLFILAGFALSFPIFVRTYMTVHVFILSCADYIIPYSFVLCLHTMYISIFGAVSLHLCELRTIEKEVCPLPRGSRYGSVETCRNVSRPSADGYEADAGGPLCQS